MALKKKPVNGMKDILPREAKIRDYVTGIIKDTYKSFGFSPIETPVMEDISNLLGSKGGENEKLIFKVLKRGEKLNIKDSTTEEEVVDYGLRYDLTVPLCRFFSCHENELGMPFKALQMGNVWRADRPQKGRYRQFMQCDIDIFGEPTNLAEIELILATGTCVNRIGFDDVTIRINDRGILRAMAASAGFPADRFDDVFISLDKMDKVGVEGVKESLINDGFSVEQADKYMSFFEKMEGKEDMKGKLEILNEVLITDEDKAAAENLITINDAVISSLKEQNTFKLIFDPTLVRGMGYYTGTIFEISLPQFSSSCGGGGRYDNLVGKFSGKDVPACGFSIGFERIVMLLMDSDFTLPEEGEKIAFLIEKGYPRNELAEIFKEASDLRLDGKQVMVVSMNKNKKFQKEQLTASGYTQFKEFYISR